MQLLGRSLGSPKAAVGKSNAGQRFQTKPFHETFWILLSVILTQYQVMEKPPISILLPGVHMHIVQPTASHPMLLPVLLAPSLMWHCPLVAAWLGLGLCLWHFGVSSYVSGSIFTQADLLEFCFQAAFGHLI